MDLGVKRDIQDAVVFYFAQLVVIVGLSTVLFHFLGMFGVVHNVGAFFDGGDMNRIAGSLFVLWLGGTILHKRNATSDILSVIMVVAGLYLAWTGNVMLGMVPVAMLTTMGGKA
jgi:hypothetical protein